MGMSSEHRLMGRKKVNFEQIPGRFPDGTRAQIEAALRPHESQSDFLREAVKREIERRQEEPPEKKP